MKLIGRQPSEEFVKHYRRLDRNTAHTAWQNFSKAVAPGSEGNSELRRCLQGKNENFDDHFNLVQYTHAQKLHFHECIYRTNVIINFFSSRSNKY